MQHADIYKYYHPMTAERPPKAVPIIGWSSAVFIDLAIQESSHAI
jgi:putative isomerase